MPIFKIIKILKNSKGVALLQTLFLVTLIIFIVNQVNFEAAVEYTVNSQALHRIKSYQAAKSGVEISLLRIKIYNQAVQQFGSQLGDQAQLLTMIYSFPLVWPMILPGSKVSSIDKDQTKAVTKKSLMDSTFATQIQSEDKLNINDIDSPSEAQREKIKNTLRDLFKAKYELDRDWVERNRNLIPYEDIINNIQDWVDPDTKGANGPDESSYYSRMREMDPDNLDRYPPNRHFRDISELRMVYGVTDAVFDLISPSFSVFGAMGINPNLADQKTLKSLHKSITDEIANKLISRREKQFEGGPYKDAEDFFNYVSRQGGRISQEDQEKIPLRFSNPCNFNIQSSGSSGKTVVTITAITYDISCSQTEVSANIDKQNKEKDPNKYSTSDESRRDSTSGNDPSKKGSNTQTKKEAPKGPPRIVYWNEN